MSDLSESTVLIVDDVASNRRILSLVLTQYNLIEAESGEAALALIADKRPDIVLLDINMPGIDGYEVCKRLKRAPATTDIPVIFITGANTPGLAGRCLSIGAVDFITKPFELEEIKARVRTHLTLKKTSTDLLLKNQQLEERIREQRLNNRLARHVLELIDYPAPRYIKLVDDMHMFVHVLACSCHDEGGDHYLIKTRESQNGAPKTVVSVKDQSGHSVNCILRSIVTDLLHNSIHYTNPDLTLQQTVSLLNNAITGTGLLAGDDFFTALFLELDHETFDLEYIAAGHPSFYLLRNNTVLKLPGLTGAGANLPLGFQEDIDLQSGRVTLLEGDRIIMYTDGLTEIPMSCEYKALSSSDLEAVLQEMVDRQPAMTISAIMNNLPAAIIEKAGGSDCEDVVEDLHDDITMIGLELTKIAGHDWHIFIPSEYNGIDGLIEAVYSFVTSHATACGVKLDDFKLRMALTEGVLNAWKHGNGSAQDKPILVSWQLGNDFSILIKDQGEGFDYCQLKNPIHPSNRTFEHGRGIFCMKKYADFVGWQEHGSILLLSFQTRAHPWDSPKRSPGSRIDLWQNPLPEL